MFVRVAVHGEIQEIVANTAVIKKRVALTGRAIPAQLGAIVLQLNKK